MLFTDSGILTIADLKRKVSDIQSVIDALKIASADKIADAIEDNQVEFSAANQLSSNVYFNPSRILGRYLYGEYTNLRFAAAQVVVTTELKRWLVFHCLETIYRDAYHQKKADKYEPLYTLYKGESAEAFRALKRVGIGYLTTPLPQPGAAGLTEVSGGALAARSYDIQLAWYSATAQPASNTLSGPSVLQSLALTASNLANIDISALTPPDGSTVSNGNTPYQLASASGWNVYAALTGSPLLLQTLTPLPIGTKTWTEPPSGLLSGTAPVGTGQLPEAFRLLPQTFNRG